MASDAVNRKKRKKKGWEWVFGTVLNPCPLKTVFTIYLLGTTLISENYLKRKKVLVERRAPVKWWIKETLIVVSD